MTRAEIFLKTIRAVTTRAAREDLRIKAKVVFERGAYKKYVTRSKSAFNAEPQVRSHCVPIEPGTKKARIWKPNPGFLGLRSRFIQ